MSRQMHFQMSGTQFREAVKRLVEAHGEGLKGSEIVDKVAKNGKDRDILIAVLGIMMDFTKKGKDVLKVRKVIAWRGADGKPDKLEVQSERSRA